MVQRRLVQLRGRGGAPWGLAAAFGVLGSACSGFTQSPDPDPDQCSVGYAGEIRVATWWNSEAEVNSLEQLGGFTSDCNGQSAEVVPMRLSKPEDPATPRTLIRGSYENKQALQDDEQLLLPGTCAEQQAVIPDVPHQGCTSDAEALSQFDAIITNGGADIRAYSCASPTQSDADNLTQRILDLDSLSRSDKIRLPAIDKKVLANTVECEIGGAKGTFGVPIGVHRLNTLFVNTTQLCALHLQQPTPYQVPLIGQICALPVPEADAAWQTAFPAGPVGLARFTGELHHLSKVRDEATSPKLLTLFLGEYPGIPDFEWTSSMLIFENVMASNAVAYANFWSLALDRDQAKAVLNAALTDAAGLLHYAEAVDETAKSADAGALEVARGQALFSVMGDWVMPEVNKEAAAALQHVVAIPFPGTQGTFVYGSDVLTFPKHPRHGDHAVAAIIQAAMSESGQQLLQQAKGYTSLLAPSDEFLQSVQVPGLTHVVGRGKLNELPGKAHGWMKAALKGGADTEQGNLVEYILGERWPTAAGKPN